MTRANPTLCAEVDKALAKEGKLDESTTQALFQRHIADFDSDKAQSVAEGFQRVLADMAESAAEAGDQTQRFGSSLSQLSDVLQQGPGAAPGTDAIVKALADTREMQQAMTALQQSVEESRREIEALREEVRRARQEAQVDSLTGLANRRAFDQQLQDCIDQTSDGIDAGAPCLILSDIDHFKNVNDQYGHSIGDQVIKAVAAVLKAHATSSGLAARVGGEEFALLLPQADLAAAQALAENIRQRIGAARLRRSGSDEILSRVTLSLGVAAHRPGESARELIERADRALYESKNAGRDRVTVLN